MAKLSSAKLRENVKSAGIKYLPADQTFYRNFPYKVELSPKFKGLGGVSGKRSTQIDISDPIKGRQKLAEFNAMMDKIFSNVEYRQEIRDFVERLPKVEYKTRMGGENNLFYFRDPELVMILIDRYRDVINSVTGPISEAHEDTMDERNVVMREKLYYDRYRFVLEFQYIEEFVPTARQILEYLHSLEKETWRAHRLENCIRHFDYHAANGSQSPRTRRIPTQRLGSPMVNATYISPQPYRADKVQLYLADGNDYVYVKLLAAEHVVGGHEVVLFEELT